MRPSTIEELAKSINKKEFYKDYIEDKISLVNIGKKYNICSETVKKLVKYYKLERNRGEVTSSGLNKSVLKKKLFNNLLDKISKDELIKYYIEEDHGYYETIKHFNITEFQFLKLCNYYSIKKDMHKVINKRVDRIRNELGGKEAYKEKFLKDREAGIIKKYGSIENYQKIRSKILKKVWKENYTKMINKSNANRTKNGTFNTSKPEQICYKLLVNKFGEENIFTQYNEERYPFNCDFYIKSLDLFIELNIHWSHGECLFNNKDNNCIEKLNKWKEKSKKSKYFKNAINTWTVRDVEKYKYLSKLNHIIIYKLNDIYKYFSS